MRPGVDFIGVGVGAVIVNSDGTLFLARRGKNAGNEKGLWEFPGGAVDYGETMADALVREIHEEFGVSIKIIRLLDIVDHILPEEKQHWVSPTYICEVVSGEPTIREPDKCDEICWFGVDEIPADLSKITRINLQHYREMLNL